MSGAVELTTQGEQAELVLRHPGAKNALNELMFTQLEEATERLRQERPKTLLISGAGGTFCAGADLRLVRRQLDDLDFARDMSQRMTAVLDSIRSLPLVSVCAVEGYAVGGGAEILTATRLRVAAEDAQLRFPHAALGLSPGWGGGARLLRLVGAQRALLALSAEPISAQTALRWGLVDRVCPPGESLRCARALLEPFAKLPRASLEAALRIVDADPAQLSELRRLESGLFESLWGGPAQREALQKLRVGR